MRIGFIPDQCAQWREHQRDRDNECDKPRLNPKLDTEIVLTQLAVGEALVSLLDENGQPGIVERVWIVPPRSQIGPITAQQRQQIMQNSLVAGVYEKVVDRESAYEKLKAAHASAASPSANPILTTATAPATSSPGFFGSLFQKTSARGDSIAATAAKSAARTAGSEIMRYAIKGVGWGIGTSIGRGIRASTRHRGSVR